MTKYLETLFNLNLISHFCQFLMVFIKRTKVLVDIVIFKGTVMQIEKALINDRLRFQKYLENFMLKEE